MGEFDSHRDEATGGLLHTNKLVLLLFKVLCEVSLVN